MAILACDIKTCMYQRVTLILKNEATVCTDVTFLLMRLSSIFFSRTLDLSSLTALTQWNKS